MDILLQVNYDAYFSPVFFALFAGTHSAEAFEFLLSQISFKNIIIIFGFIAFSCAFLLIKTFRLHIYIATTIFVLCAGFLAYKSYGIYESRLEIGLDGFDGIHGYFYEKLDFMRWAHTIKDVTIKNAQYIAQHNEIKEHIDKLLQESAFKITQNRKIKNVVLIIGESTTRNVMGIYGNKLDTTPNLQKLIDSENLILFSDVISPHSFTNESLRKTLTFANYENTGYGDNWFKYLNIVDLMNFAKFKTLWISNQDPIAVYGNAPENIAKQAQHTYFASYGDGGRSIPYDEVVLEIFDSLQNGTNKRLDFGKYSNKNESLDSENQQFVVFHLYGAHISYGHRFTKDFAKFSPEVLKANNLHYFENPNTAQKELDSKQLTEKSAYMNAVYYNDFVVSEIFKRFADDESLIFYFSDHGDEVFEFRDFFGHTESMASASMVEIPFMVFVSDKLKASQPDLIEKLKFAKDRPFMNDDFIHLFMDILQLDSENIALDSKGLATSKKTLFESQRSPLNERFDINRKRYYYGYDYDEELKGNFAIFNNLLPFRMRLHATNNIDKFNSNVHKFQGFEFDVHLWKIADNPFLSDSTKELLKSRTLDSQTSQYYFDITHDGFNFDKSNPTAGLSLDEYFANAKQKQDELKREFKFWVDFKNLDSENEQIALKLLENLCAQFGIKKENLIIESGNFENLASFRNVGFETSYYVPYYTKSEQNQNTAAHLRRVVDSENVKYLSFPAYLYGFIKSLDLRDKNGDLMPLLTWNESKKYLQNMNEYFYLDSQIRVILNGQ